MGPKLTPACLVGFKLKAFDDGGHFLFHLFKIPVTVQQFNVIFFHKMWNDEAKYRCISIFLACHLVFRSGSPRV